MPRACDCRTAALFFALFASAAPSTVCANLAVVTSAAAGFACSLGTVVCRPDESVSLLQQQLELQSSEAWSTLAPAETAVTETELDITEEFQDQAIVVHKVTDALADAKDERSDAEELRAKLEGEMAALVNQSVIARERQHQQIITVEPMRYQRDALKNATEEVEETILRLQMALEAAEGAYTEFKESVAEHNEAAVYHADAADEQRGDLFAVGASSVFLGRASTQLRLVLASESDKLCSLTRELREVQQSLYGGGDDSGGSDWSWLAWLALDLAVVGCLAGCLCCR